MGEGDRTLPYPLVGQVGSVGAQMGEEDRTLPYPLVGKVGSVGARMGQPERTTSLERSGVSRRGAGWLGDTYPPRC